jgi:hypothetical protein
MHFGVPFVANLQASKPVQPRECAFHHPAMPPQAFFRLDTASCQARHNTARSQRAPLHAKVVALVAMQLRRSPPGSSAPLANRRDRVHGHLQHLAVIDVGRRDRHCQGDALAVDHKMALRARFASIRWIRAGFVAPPGAATLAASIAARDQSICSAWPSWFNNTWWSFCHTPARCHARKRRQQVIPLPQPISCGSISHGMPLLSTKTMPDSAARCGTGRRPPLGRGRGGGNNGSMSPHNSSDTSSCAIPLHTSLVCSHYSKTRFVRRSKALFPWEPKGKRKNEAAGGGDCDSQNRADLSLGATARRFQAAPVYSHPVS